MKLYLILTVILCTTALCVPMIANTVNSKIKDSAVTELTEQAEAPAVAKESDLQKEDTIKVVQASTGAETEVSLFNYITGVVAGEMPASFNIEALKAQAVVSSTYAKYITGENPALSAITDSPSLHQSYIDKQAQKEKWGDNYDGYRSIIEEAVRSVYGEILTFNGEPAMTVFHALSPKKTNSAEDIWTTEVPYLISVSSPADESVKKDFTFSSEQFKKLFSEKGGVNFKNTPPKTWAKITAKTENGFIKTLTVEDKSFTAAEVSDILSLSSSSFTAKYENDSFIFTATGKGHGVGMSQYGAEYMANQGKNYKEILAHYYPGTELTKE